MRVLITKAPFNLNWIEFVAKSVNIDEQIKSPFKVSIYPNPSSDVFNIQFDIASKENLTLAIYDFNGKFLELKEYQNVKNFNQSVSFTNYPKGQYIIKLSFGNGVVYTQKVNKLF